MKKLYVIMILAGMLVSLVKTNAQGIFNLWGTSDYGGVNDQGVLYSIRPDGLAFKNRDVFQDPFEAGSMELVKPVVFNNKIYSVFKEAGMNHDGYLFEYDPLTGTFTNKFNFFLIGGSQPDGGLTVYNGKLYGTTQYGGANNEGILFEYNPANNTCIKRHDFANATGRYADAAMVVYNNRLYGTTAGGGANGVGTVFEFDPATFVYSKKADFTSSTTGSYPRCDMEVFNNLLWGVTPSGGDFGDGVIFEFNPATNSLLNRGEIASIGGYYGCGNLSLVNNKFYGVTNEGGSSGEGIIFEFNPQTFAMVKKIDFVTPTTGTRRCPTTVFNNKLYGLNLSGGVGDEGVLFEYDPATNTYLKKVDLSASLGSGGCFGMALYNSKLYGITSYGGAHNEGVLFEYNPVPNSYLKKIEFGANTTGFRPSGNLTYYNGKLYGTTYHGGSNNVGVIYSYDIRTKQYTVEFNMVDATGRYFDQGGMILHNNKFYGVTARGGLNDDGGVLFEFDPATNTYTKRVDFQALSGYRPVGQLLVYNNKIYGTTHFGGINGNGTVFEYDPATHAFVVKVHLSDAHGENPASGFTLYEGKLWATTQNGGVNNAGAMLHYEPGTNTLTRKFSFDPDYGSIPYGNLVVHDNKLWGSLSQDPGGDGRMFAYIESINTLYSYVLFVNQENGRNPRGTPMFFRNKLYGVTNIGGDLAFGGVMFEFDPEDQTFDKLIDFTATNGRLPRRTQVAAVPAPVAPGVPGTCKNAIATVINAFNQNDWVSFTDEEGNAIAEINSNGQFLGNVTVSFYVHNGPVRQDGQGRYYLDRNITITTQAAPTNPVQIRLYIKKSEFDALKNTPGSGVNTVNDLSVFKNSDGCEYQIINLGAKHGAGAADWDGDYVLNTTITSFSSFYFASRNFSVLPVNILSFTGTKEPAANKLEWQASCTDNVEFVIERSIDGVNFQPIGNIMALQQDCDKPFQYMDMNFPVKAYYRLLMKELNGSSKYSSIILLNRELAGIPIVKLMPNPVIGTEAVLQINSDKKGTASIQIVDMNGRLVKEQMISVTDGVNNISLHVGNISAGVYQIIYQYKEERQVLRMVKQ